MPASYPSGYDTMPDPGAGLNGPPLHSTQHIAINDVIEAIEVELGLNPSGADATVAATLAALPARYAPLALGRKAHNVDVSAAGITAGTAPANLGTGPAWTAVAGRYYVITHTVNAYVGTVAGDIFGLDVWIDGAASALISQLRYTVTAAAAQDGRTYRTQPFQIAAGVHTPWIVATRLAGTGTLTAFAPRIITVEDV